jgi:UDP-3-O-[3-hydroxymyristoyl] glucosamine N-acyltransferase
LIGENVVILNNVNIDDDVAIGNNSIIYSGVVIYKNCIIGSNCTIHSGCVIGSDGFGFALNKNGSYKKILHNGNVVIKDNVDIGANRSIDRATLGSTIIHNGVKLDNQIQIAHNVEIESHTVIAAQSGIAGSSKIGKNCIIGGQTGFAGHLTIGNNSKIQGKAGVISSLPENSKVQGSPAINYSDYSKSYVLFKNLRKLEARLSKVQKEIKP